MRKGRENWDRHKLHMWKGPGTASGPQDIETATSSLDQKRLVSSQSLLDSHAYGSLLLLHFCTCVLMCMREQRY